MTLFQVSTREFSRFHKFQTWLISFHLTPLNLPPKPPPPHPFSFIEFNKLLFRTLKLFKNGVCVTSEGQLLGYQSREWWWVTGGDICYCAEWLKEKGDLNKSVCEPTRNAVRVDAWRPVASAAGKPKTSKVTERVRGRVISWECRDLTRIRVHQPKKSWKDEQFRTIRLHHRVQENSRTRTTAAVEMFCFYWSPNFVTAYELSNGRREQSVLFDWMNDPFLPCQIKVLAERIKVV